MTVEHLLSAYIDANIVLITITIVWFAAKRLISLSPIRSSYKIQLNLLYGLFAMVVVSPFIFVATDFVQGLGIVAPRSGLNFSDFLVAQYLHGNIALAPTEFERLLMWRSGFTRQIASFASVSSYLIVGGLLGGFLWVAYRNGRDTLFLMKMIKNSFMLRRAGRLEIRFTHETRVPFSTRGLFKHYIVLPTDLLAHQNDVRIAVSHELQHVRQHDLSWEIALELLRPFFFWNPAFILCKRDVEQLRELSCDQQVLGRKTHPIGDYCECLLRVCQNSLVGHRANQIITPSVPFVQIDRRANASHSGSFLKTRILSVLDQRTACEGRAMGSALMIVSLVVALGATLALRPTNDWSQDRLMLSAIVNLERLNTRTKTP